MSDIGVALYSLLVIWAIGLLLIRRLELFRHRSLPFIWGAALGVGGGVLTLLLLIMAGLTGRLSVVWGYLLLLVAAIVGHRSVLKDSPGATATPPARWTRVCEIGLFGVLATIVLAMLASGSFGALAGDGWAIWAFKAKVFFLSRHVDLGLLRDETHYGFAHLDYPLLLPLMEWWVYAHLGHVNDSVVRLVLVGYYLSLLAAFYGSLQGYIGRTVALLCTVLLALLGPAAVNTLDGYADLIQGYYALLGFVAFVHWVCDGQPAELAFAGVSLALGAHAKAEGVSWVAAMTLAAAARVWLAGGASSARLRAPWPFLVITVAVTGLWPLYRWVCGIPVSPLMTWPTRSLVTSRLPVILRALQVEAGVRGLGQHGWGLLWAFTLLGGLRAATHTGPWRRPVLCCWLPLLLQGLIASGFYLLTAAPLNWHLETSLARVLLQLAPSCLWASAATLIPAEPFKMNGAGGDGLSS